MKVKIEFLVFDTEGKRMKGRQTWIVKIFDEGMSFGSIYSFEKDAYDMTQEEFQIVKDSSVDRYEIVEVIN